MKNLIVLLFLLVSTLTFSQAGTQRFYEPDPYTTQEVGELKLKIKFKRSVLVSQIIDSTLITHNLIMPGNDHYTDSIVVVNFFWGGNFNELGHCVIETTMREERFLIIDYVGIYLLVVNAPTNGKKESVTFDFRYENTRVSWDIDQDKVIIKKLKHL